MTYKSHIIEIQKVERLASKRDSDKKKYRIEVVVTINMVLMMRKGYDDDYVATIKMEHATKFGALRKILVHTKKMIDEYEQLKLAV